MARVAEISVGDIVRGAAHYKPVAVVVVGIVAVSLFTPGGFESSADPLDDVLSLDATTDEEAGTDDAASPEPGGQAAFDAGTGEAVSLDVPPPSPSFSSPSFSSPSFGAEPAPGSDPFGGGGGDTSFAGPGLSGSPGADDDEPLRLAATAWASASAGTPLADAGVPEGTLPVGSRLGQLDKATFVVLTGSATELVLLEEPEGRRDAPTGDAPAIRACAIDEPGWEQGEAQSFDEAPTWDEESCVVGVGDDDGRWVFDLATFPDPTDPRGFALVPTDDAPVDFQVAFVPDAAGA